MHDTPDPFLAVTVHREKAVSVPPGCQLLAATDHCAHAFRVMDKPFWAFQFHPEVDRETLVARLTVFKDHYTEDDSHLQAVLDAAEETPESNRLPAKFIERVLLGADTLAPERYNV